MQIVEEPELHCTDVEEAEALLKKHRVFLNNCMAKKKEGVVWSDTSIFTFLKKRVEELTPKAKGTPKDRTNDDNSDDLDEINAARLAKRGKSALRPASGKLSMKGTVREQSHLIDDDDDVDMIASPRHARESSPLKRKNSASHESSRQKRAQTDELRDTDSSNGALRDPGPPLPLPRKNRRPGKKDELEAAQPKIVEKPIPSYEPQGPGDTWTCNIDGCTYPVYAARTAQGRSLIKDHYHSHAVSTLR